MTTFKESCVYASLSRYRAARSLLACWGKASGSVVLQERWLTGC
jgi:hypothetical protein